MGQKLAAYFEVAKAKGGLSAQIKLAAITKMSAAKAASAEDSNDNIKLFEKAMSML